MTTRTVADRHQFELLQIKIRVIDGTVYDITQLVTELVLYESIYNITVSGEMALLDNSGILATYPLVGQEEVQVTLKLVGQDTYIDRLFVLGGPTNIRLINENAGGATFVLKSPETILNYQNTFSRTYSGLNTDIISKIYKDFFNRDVEIVTQGGSSHNVVLAYQKPFEAVEYLIDETYSIDGTNLFVYDRLYDDTIQVKSYKDMYLEDPIIDLTPHQNVNTGREGEATRTMLLRKGSLYNYTFRNSFDVMNMLDYGAYKHDIQTIDVSRKTFNQQVYDQEIHGPGDPQKGRGSVSGDYLSDDFKDNVSSSTRIRNQISNSLQFETLSNVSSTDPIGKSNFLASRLKNETVMIYAQGDYVTDIKIGNTVFFDQKIFKPEDAVYNKDYLNSGKYIVSSLAHKYKLREQSYTIDIDLMRDGANDE